MKSLTVAIILTILLCPPSLFQEELEVKENEEISSLSDENAQEIYTQQFLEADFIIAYPRCSNPVIVEKGARFTIMLENFSYSDVEVKLYTAYEPVVDEIDLEVLSFSENSIVVRVPENTPEELYNLTVVGCLGCRQFPKTEPRAVSVVEKIDGNFTFVHISDFHIGDIRGFKENIRETIGWKAAKKCVEEVNLLHPDFVVITGDLVFGQLYPFEYSFEYRTLYEILQQFDVPTYLCPGNHDGYVQCGQDGFKFWQKYFGPLYYSFDYGKAHFIMANSYDWPKVNRRGISYVVFQWGGYIGKEQLKWIEEDLKESNAKLKFIALHHNPLWNTTNDSLIRKIGYVGRKELLSLIEEYDVDGVLAGHVHYDNVTIRNDTIYITTTTAASSLDKEDAYWGYRPIEIKNWSIYSYNYKEPEYSVPSYRLNITFEGNDRAIIRNDLDMDVVAHLSFVLPSEYHGKYEVKNGVVIMERMNDELLQIYVVSTIDKKTEKEIYVELL
ncbi:MAG: hypothetical protein DRN29_00420 [Thermoplasmata archaeon]|nr:MAG: hypothetical protein DRN29_00420 [Thermoplasmata archaeon]